MGKNSALNSLLILLIMVSFSCKDKVSETFFIQLETRAGKTIDSLSVTAKEMSQTFMVKSNGAWNMVTSGSSSSWISITPDSGDKNGTFNLQIAANDKLKKRTAELSGFVKGEKLATLNIEQAGRYPDFVVSPAEPEKIPGKGGEITFNIQAEAEWEYTLNGAGWLSEKSKSTDALVLQAAENTSETERTVNLIFSVPAYPEITQEVKVTQEGKIIEPVADLLDVVFEADGTARDVSPLNYNMTTVAGSSMTTLYSGQFERYLARFSHSPGASVSAGYYKRDYTSDQNFKNALADGHTLEAMFMLDLEHPLPNAEIKMLTSHQGGGTGLMLGNRGRNNSIIFLPNTDGNYRWANSNITPERGRYYHVVGVWNKAEGKAHVYVDGVLKGSADAGGNFTFPAAGSTWFGVGADPAGEAYASTGWNGNVVLARVYDAPLDQDAVDKLWNDVKGFQPPPNEIVLKGVSLLSKRVQIGSKYTIQGEGFQPGDKVKMIPLSGSGDEYLLEGAATATSFSMTIPVGFVSGQYRFYVLRDSREQDLGFATLTVADKPLGVPQVIAHRGYWKTSGSAQNSVAALKKAQELDIFGSEFDVFITKDGVVVLNHDPTINGIRIEEADYADLKDITLSNGEKLPTLQDYLDQAKKDASTKLILEIKTHSTKANNDRAVAAAVQMVKDENLSDQVEYIAFSLDVCKKVVELHPTAKVAYLSGNLSPQALFDMGIVGIDYNIATIRNNTAWIAEAQNLGMTVNVWTVNAASDLQEMIDLGVDYITTDEPVLARQMIENN